MVKKEFILQGLDCANCAMKIEESVGKLAGVQECHVNFATKKLTFTVDEAGKETMQAVEKIVYDLESDVQVIPFRDTATKDDKSKEKMIKIIFSAVTAGIAMLIRGNIIAFPLFVLAYLVVGGNIIVKAGKNIRHGKVFDENFLMTIATLGAFLLGEYPEAVAVMLFYQVGEFFQGLAVGRSRKSIQSLLDIRPDHANVLSSEGEKQVIPEQVQIGEEMIVRPGERIPLDGLVTKGTSFLDTSALTGESVPRSVTAGEEVFSGSINKNGLLHIKVTKVYRESAVAKILDLVENASSKKGKTEQFITKFARYYTPVVVGIAILLSIIPPLFVPDATFADWVGRGLIFLVISCPCALVVSIPLSFFGGIGAASKQGVLIKGSNYLEALNHVETVVFDKTGTLTKGVFTVTEIVPQAPFTKEQLLAWAAYGETFSKHPIALSILEAYQGRVEQKQIASYEEIAGHGTKTTLVDGKVILIGNKLLLEKNHVLFQQVNQVGTVVYVAVDGTFAGYLVIADEIKPDAKQGMQALQQLGVKNTIMLTGDNLQVGTLVGERLGMSQVYAELLPADKVTKLEEIFTNMTPGKKVMFVGDGINDTPVLTRADIGVAMGALGSDAAIEVADMVIMTDEPSKIATAIKVAKKTKKIVWQNIFFALGVKIIFLTLGAFGLSTMWEAVIADVGVTLLAVFNAMRVLKTS